MSKSKVLFTLAGFVVTVFIAIPAGADPQPEGECQNQGWDLIRVTAAQNPQQARQVDKAGNHDQWVCANPGNGQQYQDNDA